MGDCPTEPLRPQFDRRLRLEFHGAKLTSDAGLLAYRELDDALQLTDTAAAQLQDTRTGQTVRAFGRNDRKARKTSRFRHFVQTLEVATLALQSLARKSQTVPQTRWRRWRRQALQSLRGQRRRRLMLTQGPIPSRVPGRRLPTRSSSAAAPHGTDTPSLGSAGGSGLVPVDRPGFGVSRFRPRPTPG